MEPRSLAVGDRGREYKSPTAITTSSYVPSEVAEIEIDVLGVGLKMSTEY
jgi:hypothetical protein